MILAVSAATIALCGAVLAGLHTHRPQRYWVCSSTRISSVQTNAIITHKQSAVFGTLKKE